MPENRIFAQSLLITNSRNVTIEDGFVNIMLQYCNEPTWECVQGFGSELYKCISDPKEWLLLMYNFSGNSIAFALDSIDVR